MKRYFIAFIVLVSVCMGVMFNRVHALNVAHHRMSQEWKEMRIMGRFLDDVDHLITVISADRAHDRLSELAVTGLKSLVPTLEELRQESLRSESFEKQSHMLSEREDFISLRQQFMSFAGEMQLVQLTSGPIDSRVQEEILNELKLLRQSAGRLKDLYVDEVEEASAYAQRARQQILYQIIIILIVFVVLLVFVTRWFIVLIQKNTEALIKQEQGITIGLLAQSLAHEIRNPLGIISVSASAICEKLPDESEEKELADGVVAEVKRIGTLIEQLLVLNKSKKELQSCDPTKVVNDVLILLTPISEKRKVRISFEDKAGVSTVQWDLDQIKQMLINILLNAIDAAAGGTINMVASIQAGAYHLAITDSGSGFTPHARAHAFDPFFSTKKTGTGLGLFVAKNIVESHGGRLLIDPHVTSGARLEVILPLK